jgi:hypothetical protein
MSAIHFLNNVIKPWDELNVLLAKRLALQPDLSDVTRLAGALAIAIRHQVDAVGLKDSEPNTECLEHRIICDVGDFYKHGSLKKPSRNNSFSTEALFEYGPGKGFSFLRNALFVEHATLDKHDFLQVALAAIHYWINKRELNLNWQGVVQESPTEFHEEAFLNFESGKCITMSQVRLGFFLRRENGVMERVDPPEVRFAVY